MSFLDDQATGQIGIGEKASLSTLTRRKRKRKRSSTNGRRNLFFVAARRVF